VQFDAFDINLSQFPAKQLLPSNVSSIVWDMFTEPPEHLIGKYDIVHIRLIYLMIDNDPTPLLQNFHKLLKPGGWLQWDELDLSHTEIFGAELGLKVDAVTRMDSIMKSRESQWVVKLPESMRKCGFEGVQYDQFRPRMELLRFNTDVNILSFV